MFIIVLGVTGAWLPSVRPYVRFSDDFSIIASLDHGIPNYLRLDIEKEGLWRILQQPLVRVATAGGPWSFPIIALLAHALTAVVFYQCVSRFTHQRFLPTVMTLLAFAFPWSFVAVLWASAFGNVVTTLAFWACFYLLLAARRRWRPWVALAVFAIATAALFTQENLLFAYAGMGLLALLPTGRRWPDRPWDALRRRAARRYEWVAPLTAAAVYAAAYLFVRGHNPTKSGGFHLATLLSVIARQYTNLFVLRPWLSLVCLAQAPRGLSRPVLVAAAILTAVASAGLWSLRPDRRVARVRSGGLALLLCTLALFGLSAAFVVAGGYSIDSRKKYEILPVIALWIVVARQRIPSGPFAARSARVAATLLLCAGAATTWLVCGVYAQESVRADRLARAIARARSRHPAIIYRPDVYAAWPQFADLVAYRMDTDWIVNQYLDAAGAPSVIDVSPVVRPESDCQFIVDNDSVQVTPLRHPTGDASGVQR